MNKYEVMDADNIRHMITATYYSNNNGCLDFTVITKTPEGSKYKAVASFNKWSSVVWISEVE